MKHRLRDGAVLSNSLVTNIVSLAGEQTAAAIDQEIELVVREKPRWLPCFAWNWMKRRVIGIEVKICRPGFRQTVDDLQEEIYNLRDSVRDREAGIAKLETALRLAVGKLSTHRSHVDESPVALYEKILAEAVEELPT